jgi:DNA mismatch repair ATPase MutS
MTTQALQTYYAERKQNFDTKLQAIKKTINIVSNSRLIMAAIFIAFVYFSFTVFDLVYLLPVVLVVFIILVRKHSELFAQKTHLENLVQINENEIQSLRGDFSCFNNGARFINPHHPYTHDLDIFGDRSIYQYLNRSSTLTGAEKLAASLTDTLPSANAIAERHASVKELAMKTDFRQHFWATGESLKELAGDKQQLLEWVKHPSFLFGNKLYAFLLTFLPSATIVLLIISPFVDGVSTFALFGAGLQWGILGLHLKRINAFHQYISQKKNVLEKYAKLLQLLGKEKFESASLSNLTAQATEADKKVKSLSSLVSALDARLNFMTNLVANSLLMYDMQCVYRLERWKEENASRLENWMNVVSEADTICSLATFSFNHQHFAFPIINEEQKITAQSLGHPLIPTQELVTNDVTIGSNQSILIITGANMAGKSTFLRTLGVNMVLAMNGAPVCAESFTCPIISLRSGMRTADSLQDHQSYFFAELDRLKTIIDELRSGKPLLILLDEILKGTNSTDKQAGSIALVKQLLSHKCLALIATHDLALGNLEKEYPQHIKNFCFEPTIENDQLSFDYKMKSGLATKMNATFLMKKMGIIPKE